MPPTATARFHQAVHRAVRAIPAGCVATYGEVAEVAGRPRAARAVGHALAQLTRGSGVPAHRVVAADGRLRWPDRARQADLLRAEGVPLRLRADGEPAVDWRRLPVPADGPLGRDPAPAT